MAIMRSEATGRVPRRLLLVAPSLADRSAELARRLEVHGVELTAVVDARAAMQQVEGQAFDLMVFEVAIPGGSGLELLRALRARDAQIPVVLLSDAKRPLEEAAELGAYCLPKPVTLESLLRTAVRRIYSYGTPVHRSARARARVHAMASDFVAATVAKNQFGRLLGRAMQGGRVVITKHDAPTAVLLSYDEYQDLTGADSPDLDALSHEFDELMARMQTPASREATEALFRASTAELAEAAVAEARRDARSPERG
jgi:prevent-host-death family protein